MSGRITRSARHVRAQRSRPAGRATFHSVRRVDRHVDAYLVPVAKAVQHRLRRVVSANADTIEHLSQRCVFVVIPA